MWKPPSSPSPAPMIGARSRPAASARAGVSTQPFDTPGLFTRAFSRALRTLFVGAWAALAATAARGVEGMFPVSEIPRLALSSQGLELAPAEIFSAERTCLVDGICRVNGCTGSFVSPRGLIITNHHCAYRAIQSVSTADRDYLEDGFVARNARQEIPAKGYTVRITESFSDVSPQVLEVVRDGMDAGDRAKAIEKRRKELETDFERRHPGRRAEVAEMFIGKTYVLFQYTYLKDVRLVFAPPASVGAFGGDVDNWEWPRHTGDFSFMRAYVAPDGRPAEFSPENVPFRPKRFLQVAPEGVGEEDFVFLLGYPGRTSRHKTTAFLRYEQAVRLPFVVEHYRWQIDVMDRFGREDRSVALKHSSRSKSLANVEKRSRGQLTGIRRGNLVEARQQAEQELQAFIDADASRRELHGSLLADIAAVYQEMTDRSSFELNLDQLRSACRCLAIAHVLYEAAVERQKEDLDREPEYMDRNFDQTIHRLMLSLQDLHLPTDRVLLAGLLERLARSPEARDLPAIPKEQSAKLSQALDGSPQQRSEFVESILAGTQLADAAFVTACLKRTPTELQSLDDPCLNLAISLYPAHLERREEEKRRDGRLGALYGKLIDVKQEFLKTEFVPDANGTLRLTHGRVRGYSPEDAVHKSPITTLRGVVEKTTGEPPFVTPPKILDLHRQRQFGRFAHPMLKDVPVAILYDTDTTGGNSGSPILNARGQLVGVNFDRAFEATINDFAWNRDYSRSIGVDVRYALWITDQVYQARGLLKEMGVETESR